MSGLLALSRAIDAVTAFIGRHIIWLILAAILVSAVNAIIRKAFDISSNAWLELQWYLFGAVFMLASAYTLQKNEHIRIDIISGRLSQNIRNWIDIFGHVVMLLPFTLLMVYESVPFVLYALRFILAGFFALFIQGVSELIKRIAVMKGLIPDPHPHHGHHAPLEPLE